MSERVLGVVEREALDRARTRLVALRAEQYELLEDIAELERLGVAEQTGDRSSIRLLTLTPPPPDSSPPAPA
jgi:hypothetical protein